ncbi:MAG: hypothetical protein ACM3SS_04220 [Rhodospirillaceae bacterium]
MAGIVPHFQSHTVLESEEWRGVTVELLGDLVSAGLIRYRFLLTVGGLADGKQLFVSAERSRLLRVGASQGFFLGLFSDGGHANLGQSRDWSDRRLFLLKAMTLVREELRRPLATYQVTRMEKNALRELWAEWNATRSRPRLREYLKAYDAALPPMLSRRAEGAA